jgi:hypothetical protein
MFHSRGKNKKQIVYSIFNHHNTEDTNSSISENDPKSPRSRSRSKSRSKSRSRSRSRYLKNSDDESGNDGRSEASSYTEINEDIDTDVYELHDYITTATNTNYDNIDMLMYRYPFIENELLYNIDEIEDIHHYDFQFVIYRINTKTKTPFLEFLLYHNDTSCVFTKFKRSKLEPDSMKNMFDHTIRQLFSTKFRYKGYYTNEQSSSSSSSTESRKCYIFYEVYFNQEYNPYFISLQENKGKNWFWVCATEIINNKRYLHIPIDTTVVDLFIDHPQLIILESNGENLELPVVLYTGTNFCYTESISKFGLRREPLSSRYGPFYYFTDFDNSFRWGCYDYRNMFLSDATSSSKGGQKYTNGGITRYAVFTGKMRTVFIDDKYNNAIIKQYKANKTIFENKSVPKDMNYIEYLDRSPSFHTYDYSWARDYNTIYNGNYSLDGIRTTNNHTMKKSDYDNIPPFWCVYDFDRFQQLTYYHVDTTNIPDTYNSSFREYNIS